MPNTTCDFSLVSSLPLVSSSSSVFSEPKTDSVTSEIGFNDGVVEGQRKKLQSCTSQQTPGALDCSKPFQVKQSKFLCVSECNSHSTIPYTRKRSVDKYVPNKSGNPCSLPSVSPHKRAKQIEPAEYLEQPANPGPEPSPFIRSPSSPTTAITTFPQVGARLASFWRVWRDRGASSRIVNLLMFRLKLNFRSKPPLSRVPLIISDYRNPIKLKKKALQQEVTDLLQKGAIEKVRSVRSLGFYSRVFLVLKKTGGWLPVTDLSALNYFIQAHKFSMETPESFRTALQPGEWVTTIDLKDTYLHIPIHPSYRKYGGTSPAVQGTGFWSHSAPRVFTELGKKIQAP